MAEYKENISTLSIDREMEDRLGQIILACGNCSVKEKVSLLYLSMGTSLAGCADHGTTGCSWWPSKGPL